LPERARAIELSIEPGLPASETMNCTTDRSL